MIRTPNFPIEILAFHGTTEDVAKKIVSGEGFKAGTFRKDHWLGQGVYFYREDYKQALLWARYKIQRNRKLQGQKAAVIYTHLSVKTHEFLNLDTREGMGFFKDFIKQMEQNVLNAEVEAEGPNAKVILRCLYCDMLPKFIKVIQRTFNVDSDQFDQDQGLQNVDLHLHGVQICVRDVSVINYEKTGICSLAQPKFSARKRRMEKRVRRIITVEEE